MIHLSESHLEIVKKILKKYPYKFYAFGSRISGKHRKFSDLDLCCLDEIPLAVLGQIQEDFERSKLPFSVDLLGWQYISKDFQKLIKPQLELIQL